MKESKFEERRRDSSLARVREKKRFQAERPGGEQAAMSLIRSASEALQRILLKGEIKSAADREALGFVAASLREISNGTNADVALCINKRRGRPSNHPLERIIEYKLEVNRQIRGGMSKTAAVKAVARSTGKSVRTVWRALKPANH